MPYIYDILKSFRKNDLLDVGAIFGFDARSSCRKDEILDRLSSYIQDQPEKWLSLMLERDLNFLKSLMAFPTGKPVWLEYAEYPTILEAIGLIHWSDEDEHFRKVWIDQEFSEIVSGHIDKAISEGERSGRFEHERLMLGILNIYGVMSYDDFIRTAISLFNQGGNGDLRGFFLTLRQSPLVMVYRQDGYVFSPCVEKPEEILEARGRLSKNRRYRKVTYSQAVEAGSDAPFFVLNAGSPQCKALREALSDIGYDDIVIRRKLHDMWMDSQFVDVEEEAEAVFSAVSEKQDGFPTFEEYQACMQKVADYVNNLPKWKLRGRSSEEAGTLRVVLKSDSAETGLLKEASSLMGLFVGHANPDEPCPCGSGLRYRNCHGKYFS